MINPKTNLHYQYKNTTYVIKRLFVDTLLVFDAVDTKVSDKPTNEILSNMSGYIVDRSHLLLINNIHYYF